MYTPKYRIKCARPCGEVFVAFNWTRGPEEGVARARAESIEFNQPIIECWAERIVPCFTN